MRIMDRLRSDGNEGLLDAALLVRRAGLEHLVTEPTLEEIVALAKAGEILAHEHAGLAALAHQSPLEFRALLDGGDALVSATVDAVLEKAAARRAPHASKL